MTLLWTALIVVGIVMIVFAMWPGRQPGKQPGRHPGKQRSTTAEPDRPDER